MFVPMNKRINGIRRTKERAYAKINLYLDVRGKREDGFHELCTVMQSVFLADDLLITYRPSEKTTLVFSSNLAFLPTDMRNLAVKAAHLYLEKTGICAYVRIDMKKRIPVAAGLAGGSSDAAAVLRALHRLTGGLLSKEELLALAADLGSDVPFCLLGGTRLCLGRGETMTKLSLPAPLYTVVAVDRREHVSTPDAFRTLDDLYRNFDGSVEFPTPSTDILAAKIEAGKTFDTAVMYNIFEQAVLPCHPHATELRERLLTLGAKAAMMSGSGPSVFGVFPDREAAQNAAKILSDEGFVAHAAESVLPSKID